MHCCQINSTETLSRARDTTARLPHPTAICSPSCQKTSECCQTTKKPCDLTKICFEGSVFLQRKSHWQLQQAKPSTLDNVQSTTHNFDLRLHLADLCQTNQAADPFAQHFNQKLMNSKLNLHNLYDKLCSLLSHKELSDIQCSTCTHIIYSSPTGLTQSTLTDALRQPYNTAPVI